MRVANAERTIDPSIPSQALAILDRETLVRLTRPITYQRDDLVATEYYLTCTVNLPNEPRYQRLWPEPETARRFLNWVK